MTVVLSDDWVDAPVWAPLLDRPRLHSAAFLLHTAGSSWLARFNAQSVPLPVWRRLPGWSKAASAALIDLGLATERDGSVALLRSGAADPEPQQGPTTPEEPKRASDRSEHARKAAIARWGKTSQKPDAQTMHGHDEHHARACSEHMPGASNGHQRAFPPLVSPDPFLNPLNTNTKERERAREMLDAQSDAQSMLEHPALDACSTSTTPPEAPHPLDAEDDEEPQIPQPSRDPKRVTSGDAMRLFGTRYVQRRAKDGRPVDGYHQFGRYAVAFEDLARFANKSKSPRESLERGITNYLATDDQWVIDKDFPASALATQWNRWVDPPNKKRSEREHLLKHGMALVSDFSHVKPMPPPDEEEKKRLREWGVAI